MSCTFISKWRPNIRILYNSPIINKPQKQGAVLGPTPAFNKFNKFCDFDKERGKAIIAYHSNSYLPIVFNDNVHNEFQAMKSRVTVRTPEVNEEFISDLADDVLDRKHFSQLFPNMRYVKTQEIVAPQFSQRYPDLKPEQAAYLCCSNAQGGVKKKLYNTFKKLNANGITEDSYLAHDFCRRATYRSSFLKIENLLYRSPIGQKIKAPRFISGAQAEFICLVGPWMMAFQNRLKKSWDRNHFITFCSGLSAEQVGKSCEQQSNKHCFEDDIGLFDVSVGRSLLKLEWKIFRRCGAPRGVLKLIKYNIDTRGATKHGFRYRVPGMRKSGDPYTSCGNSMLNGLLHYYIYKTQHLLTTSQVLRELYMLVCGDDNLGFSTRITDWVPNMLRAGFESEAKYHTSMFDAEFCSSRLYPTNHGLVMGPKPGKVLAKIGVFADPPEKANPKGLLKGVALGLYNQCSFIPPIRVYLDKILEYTDSETPIYYRKDDEWQFRAGRVHEPVSETWANLDKYYGYSKFDNDHLVRNLPCEPCHVELPYLNRMFDIDTSAPKVYYSTGEPRGVFNWVTAP